ncbi:HET-domain-containing protein [Decorospora gaudefroyi]|uniref:HET-domain-containing protein n=1 Tax=Decorospora gaudefroyi TaxID=184978 RepID=A0A6A5KGP8_9PLEO|nr:HET-domain-containing protein [Decorospora gaudefroyi]
MHKRSLAGDEESWRSAYLSAACISALQPSTLTPCLAPEKKNPPPYIATNQPHLQTTPSQPMYFYPPPCSRCRQSHLPCLPDSGGIDWHCINCIQAGLDCSLTTGVGVERVAADQTTTSALGKRKRGDDESRETVVEQSASSSQKGGVERGRTETRGRATSPDPYSDNERNRSQSPAGSFYHGESPARATTPITVELGTSYSLTSTSNSHTSPFLPSYGSRSPTSCIPSPLPRLSLPFLSTPILYYQYSPLNLDEIRLLRIAPGAFDSDLFCSLKPISLERVTTVVHDFQALSYAWGQGRADRVVHLNDLPRSGDDTSTTNAMEHRPHPIRENLFQALRHIRLMDDYSWIWVDALCIEQTNEREKSQQIPKMPEIYANAWNVIAWLGVEDLSKDDIDRAVDLIPNILNLTTLDAVLQDKKVDDEMLRCWVAFGNLLQRPWFERRWVIQEVACARRLSVRIGEKILSWMDFADAVDLYLESINRIRALYCQSPLHEVDPTALSSIENSKAVALMKLSRSVFRKSSDAVIMSRLMSLETLVLTASSFAVSDVRDVVYALLYLASDRDCDQSTTITSPTQPRFAPNYSKHPVDLFIEFTRYCISKTKALDIICRAWASWPRSSRLAAYEGKYIPTWVGVASFDVEGLHQRLVTSDDLLGPVGNQVYNASRGIDIRPQTMPSTITFVLQAEGIVLGRIEKVSTHINGGILEAECLRMLGWTGTLEGGLEDQLWRTLVANRSPDGKVAPTWYRRACALALTKVNDIGHLNMVELIADKSQPTTMIEYIERVQKTTRARQIFRCADLSGRQNDIRRVYYGLGPTKLNTFRQYVCILFGCSVPVILTCWRLRTTGILRAWGRLVGPCYIDGYMEGEMFAGMSKEEIERKSTAFRIY